MKLSALVLFAMITLSLPTSSPTSAGSQPEFSAELTSLSLDGKDSFGRQKYKISIAVTNDTGRDADLINATVVFIDKLGNTLGLLVWQDSLGIEAGKTRVMSGSYANTRGNDRFERLFDLDPKLYEVKFDVYAIAYKDGEVLKIKECQDCNF